MEKLIITLNNNLMFDFDLSLKTSGRIELHKRVDDNDYLSISITKDSWAGGRNNAVTRIVPQKYINMLDELAALDAEGNRNKLLVQLIEKHYKIKKDLQQWKSDDAIRRALRDSFKENEE